MIKKADIRKERLKGLKESLKQALDHTNGLDRKGLSIERLERIKELITEALSLHKSLKGEHGKLGTHPDENERDVALMDNKERVRELSRMFEMKNSRLKFGQAPQDWQKVHRDEWRRHLVRVHAAIERLRNENIEPTLEHLPAWAAKSLKHGYGDHETAFDQALETHERFFRRRAG